MRTTSDENAARLGSGGGDWNHKQRGNNNTRDTRGARAVGRFGPNVGQLVLLALVLAGKAGQP